ncbi:ABC transporter permease [uncultured Tateyamaria sp.]|uniref:ABC transporter permease n=1 Tax=uncultured Tateyamaria sp. TaxID=455651 RepID=UPI002612FDE2|nr:ABC transporter permease [uncultured Tateyamaria sp.]
MTLADKCANLYAVARLGYRGNAEALPVGVLLANAVLGPLFYVLYFTFVRYGAGTGVEPEQILLVGFLLMPVGTSVFYLATIFARLRNWGVLRYIIVSQVGLFEFGLTQVIWAAGIAVLTVLVVALPTMLALGSGFAVITHFSIATVIACLSLSFVGLLCAMAIISMRDYQIFINSLFFIVVLTSGVVDDLSGLMDHLLMVNPLRPLVRWMEDTGGTHMRDWRLGLACCVGLAYVFLAWIATQIQERRIETQDI